MEIDLADGIDATVFVETLQEAGYSAKLDHDEQGDPRIETRMAGFGVFIYFYNCTGDVCKAAQFCCGVTMETKPSLDKINGWNRRKRFARVYLDDDLDPVLEIDLKLTPGGSKAQFVEYIELTEDLLSDFKRFLRQD